MGNLVKRFWKPLPTGQVTERLYAARVGRCNGFLYTDGEHAIAIDATSSREALERELERLPIGPENVSHLFLTHTDFDHTGGMDAFPNAHLHLSKDEEQMIDGTTPRMV